MGNDSKHSKDEGNEHKALQGKVGAIRGKLALSILLVWNWGFSFSVTLQFNIAGNSLSV